MFKSRVFCLFVVMATVVNYCCGQCTIKYCEEDESGLYKNLMEQNKHLLQEIKMQKQQYSSLQEKQNELENNLKQVKSQQTAMQDEMNKVRSLTAFHVYMNKGSIYPNNGDIIPFNTVITNIGGGFNTTNHKFRCPVSGVYAFWSSLRTGALPGNSRRQTVADLMKDGTRLSRANCYHGGSDILDIMCSNQAVTDCQAGSTVWVQIGWRDVTLYGPSSRETTFSGFLLKQN